MYKKNSILWIAILILIFYILYFLKNKTQETFDTQTPSSATIQLLPKGIVALSQGNLIFRLTRKQIGNNKKLILYDSLHNNNLDIHLISHQQNEMVSLIDGSRCVIYAKNGSLFGEIYRGEEIISQLKFEEETIRKDGQNILTKVTIRDDVDNSEIAVIDKIRDFEWEIQFKYGLDRNIIVLSLFFFYEMEKQNKIHQKYYGV